MRILIVGAGDRRCCGYFGRAASPRNNCEFVLREIHTASAEAVWTFVGRRCYAFGPIVRTVGEHGISRNVISHATTKSHGVRSDECARTSERNCWFRAACSRTTYASRDLPGRHAKTGFRTSQNRSVALRRLSHSHACGGISRY